jgi:hypothetical protein
MRRREFITFGIPPSIASLEMIARARRAGLAQAMEDMLSEPHRPDPRDASVEEPRPPSRLRGPFFAALWELRIVEHIADLAQPPKDWRRQEFIDAVQRLIWVATVRVSVRHRARTKLDAKGMTNALAAVLRARGALQQLGGLIDAAPLEPLIADLSNCRPIAMARDQSKARRKRQAGPPHAPPQRKR